MSFISPNGPAKLVHRCRMVEWKPQSITALSVSRSGRRLAVGRQSGDIEIWDVAQGFYCNRIIPGSGDPTVQVIVWVKGMGDTAAGEEEGERLLSAGLNARLIEWNLMKLLPKVSLTLDFGFCLLILCPFRRHKSLAYTNTNINR